MIKPKFTNADLDKMFAIRINRIEDAVLSRLTFIGETFVNSAREKGAYSDQTGNLRSSIGFIVLKNGKVINENFQLAEKGTDKTKGLNSGKAYIKKLKEKFKKGYVLICVAGMDYAAAVESKGKDVITGSSIEAEQELDKLFKRKF
jgi:hypothetical protein